MNPTNDSKVSRLRHRLTSVIAVDIIGYSALSEQDETMAILVVDQVASAFKHLANLHEGRIFHKAGDGFLAEFKSAQGAMDCAIALLETRKTKESIARYKPALRIGMHIGDVVVKDDGDLLGHCVNIAAHLESQAQPNSILVSANVYNLIGKSYPRLRLREKPLSIKNMKTPIWVYEYHLEKISLWQHGRNKALKLAGVSIFLLLFWFMTWSPGQGDNSEDEISQLVEQTFESYGGIDVNRELDRDYITSVLRDLRNSGLPTDRMAFTLIEEGRLNDAVIVLEKQLTTLTPSSSDYIPTLHDIGALAYQYNPRKAIAAYETILITEPNNLAAIIRLGRSYDIIGEPITAAPYFAKAIALDPQNPQTRIWLELDQAFNFLLLGEPEKAINLLKPLSKIPRSELSKALVSKITTDYAIALERLDRDDEAEGQLLAIMAEQEEFGYITDLSRSHNVLGQIYAKRAHNYPKQKAVHLNAAIAHYKRQRDLDGKLNKQHGVSEANYFIGQAHIELDELDKAHSAFLKGLRPAREHGIINMEFLSLLGLAQLENKRANREKACSHVQSIQKIYDEKLQSKIGPLSTKRIKDTGCPFKL